MYNQEIIKVNDDKKYKSSFERSIGNVDKYDCFVDNKVDGVETMPEKTTILSQFPIFDHFLPLPPVLHELLVPLDSLRTAALPARSANPVWLVALPGFDFKGKCLISITSRRLLTNHLRQQLKKFY